MLYALESLSSAITGCRKNHAKRTLIYRKLMEVNFKLLSICISKSNKFTFSHF